MQATTRFDMPFRKKTQNTKVFRAENAELDNDSVDIVTVAQGLHWFDFDKFILM